MGTPDYIAPEVIKGAGCSNPSIDWWSVGVILFEMLTGAQPFNDNTVEEIFDNIVNNRIPWDQVIIGYEEGQISPEAKDLISRLLESDVKLRLGHNGVIEIM